MTHPDYPPDLLNEGLDLALEFGENWLKPIQERLGNRHPGLSEKSLDEINQICRTAKRFSEELIYSMAGILDATTCEKQWRERMDKAYPWISDDNLRRLFSQGMYYAWKDGVVGTSLSSKNRVN